MELNESQQKVVAALNNSGTAAAKEIAEDVGMGYSTVTGILRQLHEGGVVKRLDLDGEEAKAMGVKQAWQIVVPDKKPAKKAKKEKAPRPEGDGTRFGKGELRERTYAILLSNLDEEWSPTMIAKQIDATRVGNISGSIGHACDILVDQGRAVKTSEKPRRYKGVRMDVSVEKEEEPTFDAVTEVDVVE